MKWYKLNTKYLLYGFLLSLLSLLYIFPIVLANLYYKDDLGWSLNGSIGLKGDGRPLGEYLVLLLCGGSPVTDTAPLSLILAVLFLSYTLVLYAKTNLDSISDNRMVIPVLLLILTNPLSIECLAYRYGSFVMFTALGIAFLIFSIPETVSKPGLFLYSFFLIIALMSLYQAAIGMCLILIILAVFLELIEKNAPPASFLGREGTRVAAIGFGAVFYQAVIARHYIVQTDWRYDASQTLDLKLSSIKAVIGNIMAACHYITDFLSETALWYQIVLAVTVVSAMAAILFFYCKDTEQTGKRKAFGVAFLALSPALVLISSFLPIMLLKSLMLKTRIFIALGGFLFYLGVLLLYREKKHKTFIPVLLVLCILYHFTYIYSFGSALNKQNEYAKYLVYNIAHDLETINAEGEYTTITFIGEMPKNKQLQILYDKYPIYDTILPSYLTNNSWMGGAWTLQYLQGELYIEAETEADTQFIHSAEPVMKNSSYFCYTNADKIIVSFQ